tara:strand:- start:123 stop:518 length:396 start_codon:yes stop_codon:yes gene_type:complete
MINCHNLDCDKLFLCCDSCQVKLDSTCNNACKKSPKQRTTENNEFVKVIGRVVNYYKKPRVALIKVLSNNFSKGKNIFFFGITTKIFKQTVGELKDYSGNMIFETNLDQLITLPVKEFVRKNDRVVLPLRV